MTGAELYYFDVELVRGTPEYFETLKKNQAIQEEKEKLINQVRPPRAGVLGAAGHEHSTAVSAASARSTRTASAVAGSRAARR